MQLKQRVYDFKNINLFFHDAAEYILPVDVNQDEVCELYQKTGDEKLKTQLICSNARNILAIAFKVNRNLAMFDINDLFQEGLIALNDAIMRFNPQKGKFKSYINFCVEKRLIRIIYENDFFIRFPVNIIENIGKYQKYVSYMQTTENHTPTDNEICEYLKITPNELNKITDALAYNNVLSINYKINEAQTDDLLDVIDEEYHEVDNVLNNIVDNELLISLKQILNPLQYYIIYETILSNNLKASELAKKFNTTDQAVSIISKDAIKTIVKYLKNHNMSFSPKIKKIKRETGSNFKYLSTNPISLEKVIQYLYIKDDLTEMEKKLIYLYLFDNYDSIKMLDYYAKMFNISLAKLIDINNKINEKLEKKCHDKQAYDIFQAKILNEFYPSAIYKTALNPEKKYKKCRKN